LQDVPLKEEFQTEGPDRSDNPQGDRNERSAKAAKGKPPHGGDTGQKEGAGQGNIWQSVTIHPTNGNRRTGRLDNEPIIALRRSDRSDSLIDRDWISRGQVRFKAQAGAKIRHDDRGLEVGGHQHAVNAGIVGHSVAQPLHAFRRRWHLIHEGSVVEELLSRIESSEH
jgi:hypothetical protein